MAEAISATGTAMRTSQLRSCMSDLLERDGGRLLIGISMPSALPSQGDQTRGATGSSKVNVEPWPNSDSTQISPCIESISSRQM
jgi:hypothetical protein